MTVTVRRLRPDEHDHVGAIVVAAYDAVGRMTDDYLAYLADPSRWAPASTAVLVAVDEDDRVLGAVAFALPGDPTFERIHPPAGDACFRFLAVDPAAQGRGAGRALVAGCVELAREHGARRIAIHSMRFMTAAHRLYTAMGFDRRPDLDVEFPGGLGFGFTHDLAPDAADHFAAPGPAPDPVPWFEDAWGLRDDGG